MLVTRRQELSSVSWVQTVGCSRPCCREEKVPEEKYPETLSMTESHLRWRRPPVRNINGLCAGRASPSEPLKGFQVRTFSSLCPFRWSLHWEFFPHSPRLATCILFYFTLLYCIVLIYFKYIYCFASFSPALFTFLGTVLLAYLFPQFYRKQWQHSQQDVLLADSPCLCLNNPFLSVLCAAPGFSWPSLSNKRAAQTIFGGIKLALPTEWQQNNNK